MKQFESVKIDADIVGKVRRHSKKTKQSISGIFELGAAVILRKDKAVSFSAWNSKLDDTINAGDGYGDLGDRSKELIDEAVSRYVDYLLK